MSSILLHCQFELRRFAMEAKNKKIKLQAYDIENDEIDKAYSDLQENLHTKLSAGEIADIRRMKLNADLPDEDLLSDFSLTKHYIFGVMWRISPAKEIPSIPEGLFKNPTIHIAEIQEKEDKISLVCKEHYYFSLNNHFLVTNLPKSRIKSLQTYLNWLLENLRGDKLYRFTPKVKAPDSTRLSDIKNISFIDPSFKKNKKEEPKNVQDFKVYKFAESLLKNIIEEVPDLQDMLDKKILSAQLLVKFTKPRKMDNDDYEKLLGAYMKPIADDDGVTFKLKNGKKITGSQILRTKDVEVEMIDDTKISEQDLIQEMEQFLRELNKEL